MIERYETSHLIHVKSVRGLGMTLLPKLLGRGLVLLMLCGGNLAQTTYAQDESKIAEPSGKSVDYLKEIKPLLRDKCFSCHSSRKQEGGLRLDAASLIRKGGDSGPAYIAPSIGKSLLLKRVTDDDDNRMPPAEDGARLTAKEVAKLSAWIDAGSPAPDEVIPEAPSRHWAFLSPVKAEAPSISADWIRSDIDRFLAAEHQRIGVTAVGETSRSMLLRRASLALTGLPPTPAERRVFLDDKSEEAFENAVDRLPGTSWTSGGTAIHLATVKKFAIAANTSGGGGIGLSNRSTKTKATTK
jgi:mono/diheme cytochrome c family protein